MQQLPSGAEIDQLLAVAKSYAIRRERGFVAEKTLEGSAIMATINRIDVTWRDMQALSAKDAKYNFGRLLDMARAEPVEVEKHGRVVVLVVAVE